MKNPFPTEPPKNYLSAAEAAHYITVSEAWLEKARLKGDGPYFSKIGRRVVYSVIDLDDWISSKKIKSTSASPDTGRQK